MAKLQLSLLVGLGFLFSCTASVYTVGDTSGWDISSDLYSWASTKAFKVGDILLFQYSTYHDLNEVTKNGFNECNTTNALLTKRDGNTSIPLSSAGDRYFICGVTSHCLGGMKLQVNVQGDSKALAPAAAPPAPKMSQKAPPPHPSSQNRIPSTPSASTGFSQGARDSLVATFLSALGALSCTFFLV